MFETLKESLISWQSKNGERVKMQHAYLAVAGALLVVAGIVGLLNRDLGQRILMLAIFSAGMFLVNAIVWSLLQSAVLSRITSRRAGSQRKK